MAYKIGKTDSEDWDLVGGEDESVGDYSAPSRDYRGGDPIESREIVIALGAGWQYRTVKSLFPKGKAPKLELA